MDTFRDRNGLISIHATTLCRFHEIIKPITVMQRYHSYAGECGNINVP